MRNQLLKFGLILGLICLLATLVLSLTYQLTRPKIEAELKQEEQTALKIIFQEADSFKEKKIDSIEYFEAFKADKLIGYCPRVIANGYNGFIRIVVAIDLNGTIKGVRILEHQETPGLGAKISEIKPGEKEPRFLAQFAGKCAQTIAIKKDINAITGATISSKAVTDAINKTVKSFFSEIKK